LYEGGRWNAAVIRIESLQRALASYAATPKVFGREIDFVVADVIRTLRYDPEKPDRAHS